MKRLILGIALLLVALPASAQLSTADNVTSPIVAATDAQLKNAALDPAMAGAWLDAPMSANGDGCYIATHAKATAAAQLPDTLRHVKTCGGYNNPYASEQWVKKTCLRNASKMCINSTQGATYAFTNFAPGLNDVVTLWFTSIYNPGGTERLAFVHEENVGYSGFNAAGQGWEGRTRIGLAYSNNSGNTWSYLGRIASPYLDYMPFNIQGAPYFVYNNEFYVWYKDRSAPYEGYAVSKANVGAVLTAARAGNLGANLWSKKTANGWNTNIASQPAFPASAAEGIVHSQAAHSSDGNYYMITTVMAGTAWGTTSSYIALFTVDPTTLAWTKKMYIVNEDISAFDPDPAGNGYQYASIVDPAGRANGEVGTSFYVYSGKFKNSAPPLRQALYQWQVNTTTPSGFYKESRGFPTGTQGQNQWHYAAVYSGSHMSWNSGGYWWQPSDIYNRIYNGGASPGANDGFLMIWTAPQTGNITVRQTVRSAQPTPACGDGVDFAFQKNGTVHFSGRVAWDDTLGYGSSLNLPVVAGDNLYFYGTKGGNNYCDNLFWDPSISYY